MLVGAGGFGRVVLEHASSNYECAFVDDGLATEVDGVKVIGKISELNRLFGNYNQLIVTIGNNKLRENVYKTAKEIGFSFLNIIVSSAYISPYTHIEASCIVLNNVSIQNNASIGNGVILNLGLEIYHDSVIGNNVLIYTNSVVRSLALVVDRAWLGSTLTIGNNVVILDDCIIPDSQSQQKLVWRI